MAVIMTSSISLEEQVTFLAKNMKMLVDIVNEKDEQITLMMNKITLLTRKRANYFRAESKS